MSTKRELTDELSAQISDLSKYGFGSDEYDTATTGIKKLVDGVVSLSEIEIKQEELRLEADRLELEFQKNEIDRSDKRTKNLLTTAGLVVGVASIAATFIIEKEGSVTSFIGKKLIDKATRLI